MKKTLLSLAPLPVEVLKSLLQLSPGVPDTDVVAGHDMSAEELAKAFATADVVLGDLTFKQGIGLELLAKAGPLKLIQQPSVGYERIDVKACSERGIRVANTPGANTVSVAEHTIAMGLAMLRKLIPANRSVREGRWEQTTLQPIELSRKAWGLVGLGQIGRAVALRLRPFGLTKVFYYSEGGRGAVRRRILRLADVADIQRYREFARALDRGHAEHHRLQRAFVDDVRRLLD